MGVKNFFWKNFAKKKFFWKKFFSQSEHVSSQTWCQKFFLLRRGGSPWKSCSEWAETNFGFGIFEIRWFPGGGGGGGSPSVRYRQQDTRHSDQISRSARRDGATKNPENYVSYLFLVVVGLLFFNLNELYRLGLVIFEKYFASGSTRKYLCSVIV